MTDCISRLWVPLAVVKEALIINLTHMHFCGDVLMLASLSSCYYIVVLNHPSFDWLLPWCASFPSSPCIASPLYPWQHEEYTMRDWHIIKY